MPRASGSATLHGINNSGKIRKYAGLQVFKPPSLQVCKSANLQVCKSTVCIRRTPGFKGYSEGLYYCYEKILFKAKLKLISQLSNFRKQKKKWNLKI